MGARSFRQALRAVRLRVVEHHQQRRKASRIDQTVNLRILLCLWAPAGNFECALSFGKYAVVAKGFDLVAPCARLGLILRRQPIRMLLVPLLPERSKVAVAVAP